MDASTPLNKHQQRQVLLQILYQFDLTPPSEDERKNVQTLTNNLIKHFDHFKVPEVSRDHIAKHVAHVLLSQETIDELIVKHLNHWKLERLPNIERCILRLAVSELILDKATPTSVILKEAMNLTEEFLESKNVAQVNGVLHHLSQTLQNDRK